MTDDSQVVMALFIVDLGPVKLGDGQSVNLLSFSVTISDIC